MTRYYPALLSLTLLITTTNPSYATPQESQPTVLDEIVVTASRTAENSREVSSNITVISATEIDQSPSQNLGDLLTEHGIAHIQKYPGSLTSIGIRGFRTDTHGNDLQGHVLILLDGRRAGTGNAAKMLTKNVERVEIIRGPGAVQYGSAGIGGVINVITRRGQENTVFVETGVGSFERIEGSIGATAQEGAWDFSGTVTTSSIDDYDTGDGTTFHNTAIAQETGVSLNAGYTLSEEHRLGINFSGYDVKDSGSPGYISSNDLDDTNDKSNYSIDTQYTGAAANYQWMARYFFGQDKNTWSTPIASNPDGWDTGTESENTTNQQGAQAQLTGLYGSHTVTAGVDWVYYDIENSWSPEQTSYQNPAFFVLSKSKFFDDRLIANLGLRYDWFKVEVDEPEGRSEDQDHLTPQIGFAYLPSEHVKLRLQYAQGFMMPSANQLAIDSVSWGTRTVGNPDLDPETSHTYEGGIDYAHNSFQASLSYFYTSYEDKISTSYLLDGSQSWENVGDATISGFETGLSYDIGELLDSTWEFKPYLNLTFLTEFEDEETGDNLLYTSETNLSTGLVVNNGQGIFCRFNLAYYGSQEVTDYESGSYPAQVVELENITVADLTASYRFLETENYGSLTIRGEITNLFDEEYAFVKGYPMPGRSIFVSLRWNY